VQALCGTTQGDLWVGTRTHGAYSYDGETWRRHDVGEGLADSYVRAILETREGSILAATRTGISRFDGTEWVTHALPSGLAAGMPTRGGISESRDGSLWINHLQGDGEGYALATIRYVPDRAAPDTWTTVAIDEISQPGNTVVSWAGADPWNVTPAGDLVYSCRLDGGAWSPFSSRNSEILSSLAGGEHAFEVKARDLDFNIDPSPAMVQFMVTPPVWQQRWFVGLVVLFLVGIGVQTGRVVRRGQRLREAKEGLETRVRERTGQLEEANVQLQEGIHKRRRAEEALTESEKLHRSAIEALDAVVYRMPPDGRAYEFISESVQKMVGYTPEEFTPVLFKSIVLERRMLGRLADLSRDDALEALRAGEIDVWQSEIRVQTKGGEERWLANVAALAYDGEEAPTFHGILLDITERKRMEQELVRLERLRALGELSAGVSHNLNNILTSVLGPAQLLQRMTDDTAILREAGDIVSAATRARDLVHRLHLSTRGLEGDGLQPVETRKVIEEAVPVTRPRWKDEPESRGVPIELILQLEDLPPIAGSDPACTTWS
jgi:PAS domain S-box-containing protein